jgi:phosphate/sulfate permease
MTPKVSQQSPRLCSSPPARSGPIAVPIAAVGSVGLMLYAGHCNNSQVLLVLFRLWVLSPFMALVVADAVSKH